MQHAMLYSSSRVEKVVYKTSYRCERKNSFRSETVCVCVCVCVLSLHPGDLYPFTRKPLFVIIDSDNSSAFEVSWAWV